MTFDYVLYDLSYTNISMYGAVIPSLKKKTDKVEEEIIQVDDPRNKDKVNDIFNSFD